MQRSMMDKLIAWKASATRKPLILHGCRQTGKTFLLKEFGAMHFKQVAYVLFLGNANIAAAFSGSLEPSRLLAAIAAETGIVPNSETLIIFDEIQECPRALTSLKMFHEQRPDLCIACAGSLLGVALHEGVSFPVGKVDHLFLHPMTFCEYLNAVGQGALVQLLASGDFSLIDAFAERYTDHLKNYLFVGGMPEAVAHFVQTGDYAATRAIQRRILLDYEFDFSKHAGAATTERIRHVWRSVSAQLARENKKFTYSAVRKGARARTYEEAIDWLADAGMVNKVSRVTKPGTPLAAYVDENSFKLYFVDVGLLGAASNLDASAILRGSAFFEEFKGALTEQYACQEFVAAQDHAPYYWSAENSSGEVDFVFERAGSTVPLEVKASVNVHGKSLRAFADKYGVALSYRTSLRGFAEQGWMTNIPLYALSTLLAF